MIDFSSRTNEFTASFPMAWAKKRAEDGINTDASGNTSWTYDNRGRVIEEIKSINGVGSFKTVTAYNSAGLLDLIQYPDDNANAVSAARTFLYHPQLSLKEFKYTSSLSYVKDIQYDAAGRIISRTLGNNLVLTNSYKDWDEQGGRLDSLQAMRGQIPVQNLEYTYDDVGNITLIRDHVAEIYPIEWQDQDYTYDDLNRLISAAATGSPAQGGYSESYTYNANTGNLSSKAGTSYTYGDTNHDHAVTQVGSNTYGYDANGNMTSRNVGGQNYTLGYDAEGRLISVSGAATAAFVYDGNGQRVISTIGTTTTGFVGDHTEWQVGAANQPTRYYNAGGMRLATRVAGVMYYPLADHLGSTGMTTDANGYEVAEIRYKAWGESRYTYGTQQTKHTYTGQYSNVSDFGLMYYNARWYDSTLGRFTSADTLVPQPGNPQDWDRYCYSRDNPINYSDPSGHWTIPSFNFNSQQLAESVTNWALNLTGLSKMGYTTTDVQQVLSYAGVGADIIAECTDVIAVGVSATALIAGTALGVPEVGYATGELLASPLLLFGNFMATGATIVSLGSDLLTGDTGLELSVYSNDSSMQINGELSIGTGSTVGLITTGIGWIPGVPSYASLGLQSIAVANDFSLGQKMDIFNATSYKIPFNISNTTEGQNSYVPPNQINSSNNQTLLPY